MINILLLVGMYYIVWLLIHCSVDNNSYSFSKLGLPTYSIKKTITNILYNIALVLPSN